MLYVRMTHRRVRNHGRGHRYTHVGRERKNEH